MNVVGPHPHPPQPAHLFYLFISKLKKANLGRIFGGPFKCHDALQNDKMDLLCPRIPESS